MTSTRVTVGPPEAPLYAVEIAAGLASRLDEALDAHRLGARRILASTPPIWQIVRHVLPEALRRIEPILLPDGERSKHLQTVSRVYDALLRAGADRATTLVAVGGGVLGDTAGFAAATFLRGIPLVHVPTTLLAQVDSAIGGKVGVNHLLGKNLIGAFYPPRAVLVDPELLGTLPRREFRAGLYEVIKYAVIASADLFGQIDAQLSAIFARDPGALVPVIAACCGIKARVVTADEREGGERRILNFGHTVGHALEAVTRYRRFRHGEAVAYGMLAATRLAVARGAMPRADADAVGELITQLGPLPPVADLSPDQAVDAMRRDKKVLAGKLHFVLPRRIGAVTIVDDVTEEELLEALRATGLRSAGGGD
jgi:3-dehydroquinate synthase